MEKPEKVVEDDDSESVANETTEATSAPKEKIVSKKPVVKAS